MDKDELIIDEDPTTHMEAMLNINFKKWHEAIKFEMESMYANQVWYLVDPSEGLDP